MSPQEISDLIDSSPMNRGMVGAEWMQDPGNLAIVGQGNVMLFEHRGPHAFEFHWLASENRGRQLLHDTRAARRKVFDRGAVLVYGLVPEDHRHTRIMASRVGFQLQAAFDTEDGRMGVYVMRPEYLEKVN